MIPKKDHIRNYHLIHKTIINVQTIKTINQIVKQYYPITKTNTFPLNHNQKLSHPIHTNTLYNAHIP